MTLEELIHEAMVKRDICAINIFYNTDGKFQANVARRERGAYKVFQNADPVACMTEALKFGLKKTPVDKFEDMF